MKLPALRPCFYLILYVLSTTARTQLLSLFLLHLCKQGRIITNLPFWYCSAQLLCCILESSHWDPHPWHLCRALKQTFYPCQTQMRPSKAMQRLPLYSASVTADLWSQKGEVFLQVSSFVLQKRPGDRESVDGMRGGDCNSESLGRAAAAGRGCPQQCGERTGGAALLQQRPGNYSACDTSTVLTASHGCEDKCHAGIQI